jgi:hypothetical protein
MKAVIVFGIVGFYLILAFAIARLCAVNAGWEQAADLLPPEGDRDFAEPERKSSGEGGEPATSGPGRSPEEEKPE